VALQQFGQLEAGDGKNPHPINISQKKRWFDIGCQSMKQVLELI
jgi:hypothetical protein